VKLRYIKIREPVRGLLYRTGLAKVTREAFPVVRLIFRSIRHVRRDERWYAIRTKSHTVEGAGASHCVYISHPKEVAALIEDAAAHAR